MREFWQERKSVLGMELLGLTAVIFIGVLYGVSIEYLGYLLAVLVLTNAAAFFLLYRKYIADRRQSDSLKETEEADSEENQRLQEAKEKEDFFVMWAHQIKTPIAALNLLLQADETDIPTCKQEVFQIENYVELALNYLRFEGMSNDLVLSACKLESLTKQVVKKFAPVFINKHLSVHMESLERTVLTDDKWLAFVLEQLISNALKYTREGGVSIWAADGACVELHIKDTGIGIRSEDLPRIFEKGFTGYNGRADKKASGIGLYLTKGICDKLGHTIRIESTVDEGTEVILTFGEEKVNNSDLTKM